MASTSGAGPSRNAELPQWPKPEYKNDKQLRRQLNQLNKALKSNVVKLDDLRYQIRCEANMHTRKVLSESITPLLQKHNTLVRVRNEVHQKIASGPPVRLRDKQIEKPKPYGKLVNAKTRPAALSKGRPLNACIEILRCLKRQPASVVAQNLKCSEVDCNEISRERHLLIDMYVEEQKVRLNTYIYGKQEIQERVNKLNHCVHMYLQQQQSNLWAEVSDTMISQAGQLCNAYMNIPNFLPHRLWVQNFRKWQVTVVSKVMPTTILSMPQIIEAWENDGNGSTSFRYVFISQGELANFLKETLFEYTIRIMENHKQTPSSRTLQRAARQFGNLLQIKFEYIYDWLHNFTLSQSKLEGTVPFIDLQIDDFEVYSILDVCLTNGALGYASVSDKQREIAALAEKVAAQTAQAEAANMPPKGSAEDKVAWYTSDTDTESDNVDMAATEPYLRSETPEIHIANDAEALEHLRALWEFAKMMRNQSANMQLQHLISMLESEQK